MERIDMNADLGEGAGADAELLEIVSSASVACGGHAGDERTMRDTVRMAGERGVSVGAHPGYPDRPSFGRAELGATPEDIRRWTTEQVERLAEVCRAANVPLRHVKAHGALYNRAAHDRDAAEALVAAVRDIDPALVLLCPPGSALDRAAGDAGLKVAREAFLDRAYLADGRLAPRSEPGAVLDDPVQVAERALALARGAPIRARDGQLMTLIVDSLCVHGDTPNAAALARAARSRLLGAGVRIGTFA